MDNIYSFTKPEPHGSAYPGPPGSYATRLNRDGAWHLRLSQSWACAGMYGHWRGFDGNVLLYPDVRPTWLQKIAIKALFGFEWRPSPSQGGSE